MSDVPIAAASAGTGEVLTAGRVTDARAITLYDLGDSPLAGTSGNDEISGGPGNDLLLAQGGGDSADGGSKDDYVEGGQGSDLVVGDSGDDDLVGGSSSNPSGSTQPDGADSVHGGTGSDLAIGDNGRLTRSSRDWRTVRANADQNAQVPGRGITLFDLGSPAPVAGAAPRFGADALSGQAGVDVILGQDGDDRLSGGDHDDYLEGQGGADVIYGDTALSSSELVSAPADAAWKTPLPGGAVVIAGQDDIAGGSNLAGHRDGADVIHGDGGDDFVVGDNGAIARVVDVVGDKTTDRVYAQRYGGKLTASAKVRTAGGGAASTRFCPTAGTTSPRTCEVAEAFGDDKVHGDAGQDVLYGQDGDDQISGGADDDDLYGELGADVLLGEDGDDAILGDRGGVQNRYENGSRSVVSPLKQPPATTYTSRRPGTVSREADLLHDVNGTDFVGGASSAAMPLDGMAFGGADLIRGGLGNDSIHAGAGDDLANGDTGGDALFGGRGKDIMWGGLGRPCAAGVAACLADAGVNGEHVDHLFGGKDEDVLDWRPRGVYGTGPDFQGRTCSTTSSPATRKDGTTDPCSWFVATDRTDDDGTDVKAAGNQHHQGVDWIYGGWDRDVMQGDQSANGPNAGDRLIDWSGVYNLYSHCNAAYGGYNDIRIPNPALETFIQQWATGAGAGRPGTATVPADVTKPGTSAYDELALVYNSDGKAHGTGSAYPSTPGHFDAANACDVF